jgi:hypothetical protein
MSGSYLDAKQQLYGRLLAALANDECPSADDLNEAYLFTDALRHEFALAGSDKLAQVCIALELLLPAASALYFLCMFVRKQGPLTNQAA